MLQVPSSESSAETFRTEVRGLIEAKLPEDWVGLAALDETARQDFVREWRRFLLEHRLLAPTWPTEFGGGGRSEGEAVVLAEELVSRGLPRIGPNDGFGISLLGNTLLRWGTDEQKSVLLPRILRGEDVWCQGYSEPEAGSDLGSVGLRADRDAEGWVLNGQKLWTTNAHTANWIFVLARTDPDVPKHKGLSFLLCPMDQDGVVVRPLTMMSGRQDFNEVFFTDARVPDGCIVGEANAGWAVAMTLIGHERGASSATLHMRYRQEFWRLVALARERGVAGSTLIRQGLAECYTKVELMRFVGQRSVGSILAGRSPGPESSISKLLWSEYHQGATELALDILGPAAMCPSGSEAIVALGPDNPIGVGSSASWVDTFYNSRAGTIYQGTSEIQRNTLGERVLGLPKEPSSTANVLTASTKEDTN